MIYFTTPSHCIAFNAKAGSSTLACAIVKTFYPEIETKIITDHNATLSRFSPEFINKLPKSFTNTTLDSFGVWQRICPQTTTPDKPILLPVRDPVERFRSAVAQFEFDVDQALDALENRTTLPWLNTAVLLVKNVHFDFQSNFMPAKPYRFPEHLNQLATDAGFLLPLPTLNKSEKNKPILSPKQINRIKAYYIEDVKLIL